MPNVIDLSQLTNEVDAVLSMYVKNVNSTTEKWMEQTAKETAKELKQTSPKRSGKYAKGWTATKKDGHWIVHNKKAPGLAHLTENGHAIVRGGRVVGHYNPKKKHIKPAEEKAIKKVEELAKQLQQTGA